MSDEYTSDYDPGYDRVIEPHERRGLGNTVIPRSHLETDIEPSYEQ
ncbi:MAG: hypothetical protein ABEI97_00095 [Candidatus Nanohaloarchaea archaeon]|nr:hypothetical protein [Candidatus Nanohaloarchaea archaeon]